MSKTNDDWSMVIKPKVGLFEIDFKGLWQYRGLINLWSYRDMIGIYKQTVLGPLWFILQPLLMTATYMIVFGRIAKLPNGETPALLFYLSGIVLWNYFQTNVVHISNTFHTNAPIMTKVYFPRLVIPLSLLLSNFYKSMVQLALLAIIYVFYAITGKLPVAVHPNEYLLLAPVLIMLMAGMSLGVGLMVSALTIRYRDLILVISFAMSLFMFVTPVVFSIAYLKPESQLGGILLYNPLSGILETFRFALFSEGYLNLNLLAYSIISVIVTVFIGLLAFNRVEKKFVDTI
jgi:lipopolysaccharide transport system permease protein